jgi:hypothetical protein
MNRFLSEEEKYKDLSHFTVTERKFRQIAKINQWQDRSVDLLLKDGCSFPIKCGMTIYTVICDGEQGAESKS